MIKVKIGIEEILSTKGVSNSPFKGLEGLYFETYCTNKDYKQLVSVTKYSINKAIERLGL